MPGLGHGTAARWRTSGGIAIVDPGLPGEESWRHLVDRLDRSGAGLARVHTVVVTHSHPDHFGGAGRVRKEVGAELITHELFRTWWDPTEDETPLEDATPNPWGSTPWGGDEYMPDRTGGSGSRPCAGQPLPGAGPAAGRGRRDRDPRRCSGCRCIRRATRPTLCLFDPAEGVLLSGHVLPTITPHINGIPSWDPLAQFFASLDRMTELEGVTIVLRPVSVHRRRRPRQGDPPPSRGASTEAARRRRIGGFATVGELCSTSSRGRGGRWPTARPRAPRAPAPARRRRVPFRERQAPLRSGLSPRHDHSRARSSRRPSISTRRRCRMCGSARRARFGRARNSTSASIGGRSRRRDSSSTADQ